MLAMTIGVFDGVHLGHQSLLQRLRLIHAPTIILTFSNHPSEILKHLAPPPLTPMPIKRILLQEEGISEIISVPFTRHLADQPFEEFLAPYSITHLILGEDAAFGKDCQGTPEALRLLGLKRGFSVYALPKFCIDKQPVSSTRIRRLIAAGDLATAQSLLGRPHFFYYSPDDPQKPTLPPDGEYTIFSHSSSGIAPMTIRIQNQTPVLPLNIPQLISFGPNLNPLLFNKICQTSLAAS
ncbi:MAG: ribF [Parachlamydiales bacterium]|nr:ribF [Parachlamydiales bacterium]